MTPHSLVPAYVRLDYHTRYAPHVHLIPTRAWLPTSMTGSMGSYVAWNTSTIDAEAMITALVTTFLPLIPSTTVYDLATVYTVSAVGAPAIPRAIGVLGLAGTGANVGTDKATQFTFNMRSSGFYPFKIVMLDFPSGTGQFNKTLPANFSADQLNMFIELGLSTNAWSARDDTQPLQAISITGTLNERLRKQYKTA